MPWCWRSAPRAGPRVACVALATRCSGCRPALGFAKRFKTIRFNAFQVWASSPRVITFMSAGTVHVSAAPLSQRGSRGRNLMRKRKLFNRLFAPAALAFGVFLIATPGASATGADVYGVGGGSINFTAGGKAFKFSFSAHTGPQGDFGS